MSPSTPAEKAAKKVEKKREKDAKKQKQALASTPLKSSDDSKLAKKNEGDSGKGGENVRKEPAGLSPMKFATAAEQQLKQAMAAVEEAKEAIKQEQERARKEEETKRVGNEWDNFLEYLKVNDQTKAILLDDVGIVSIESLMDIWFGWFGLSVLCALCRSNESTIVLSKCLMGSLLVLIVLVSAALLIATQAHYTQVSQSDFYTGSPTDWRWTYVSLVMAEKYFVCFFLAFLARLLLPTATKGKYGVVVDGETETETEAEDDEGSSVEIMVMT